MTKSILVLTIIALILPLSSACSATTQTAGLVINEAVSSNSRSLTDPAFGSPDWIELYNASGKDIDLGGYRLTEKLKSDNGALPAVTIKAGAYLLVYAIKGKAPAGTKAVSIDMTLPKSGETLYLINPQNTVICQLALPALLTDESWARRDDGGYGYCTGPTPGEKNDSAAILDAGALQASLNTPGLLLSEVLPKSADGEAWAELYNSGKAGVNLENYCLTDDKGDPTKWHLPRQTLAAGQYLAVGLSGTAKSGETLAGFKLGAKDVAVYLYDIAGNQVGDLSWQKGIPDGVSVLAGGKYTLFPTKGAQNSDRTFASAAPSEMDSSDPVRLSEVLPKNKYGLRDSDGDRFEWVELHNSASQAVSLSGYYLSDSKGDLMKWAFPDVKIEAEDTLVVFLSGKEAKPNELHASFRLSPGEAGVYFTNAGSYRVDSLALPQTIASDVSVGRDETGKPLYYAHPTPGLANSSGVADAAQTGSFDKNGVYISEVCAANDVYSGKNDWIELHNGGASAVDLSGYCLSDDASNPKKWAIPSLKIPANGYAVIEATSNAQGRSPGTAPFGIKPEGETLLLSAPNGALTDVFETGRLHAGVTSGRAEGNSALALVYFTTPTPGMPNGTQYNTGYTPAPAFSESGLYHTKAFSLKITALPNAKIFYTEDGSQPTAASTAYAGPIAISKNTPIRAIAYADGLLPSDVTTQTYLFDAPHTLPVFCITGMPNEMKILTTTDKRNYKPEFAADVEFYEADGTLGVTFLSGIRPKGRSSLDNPQNSLTMRLRGAYGQGSVTYPFFPESSITAYTTLTLRDSGQDCRTSRIRDSFFANVARGMDVDTTETRTVAAYVNGQYSGLYDLDEEQNADYLASHYGLDSNAVDMIDRNGTVISGGNAEFLRVSKLAQTMNTRDDKVFAEFAKLVDADACMDYLCTQIYFGDGDVLNQRFWRAQDYSVKWRPLLFDLDWCLRFNDAERNVFGRYFSSNPTAGNGSVTNMYIFCALKKNKAWCDKFIERYIQLAETQFSTDRILGIYDGMVSTMTPEMPLHIARWKTPRSMAIWQGEAAELRTALQKRQGIALRQLQQYFHVSNATMQKYITKYSAKK